MKSLRPWDLGVHQVSILNFVFDAMPLCVAATGRMMKDVRSAEVVALSLTYPNDVFASVLTSWRHPEKVRRVTVVGSNGMATFDDLAPRGDAVASVEPLQAQARAFLNATATGDAGLIGDAHAVNVIAVLEAVTASLGCGGASIDIVGHEAPVAS